MLSLGSLKFDLGMKFLTITGITKISVKHFKGSDGGDNSATFRY